MLLIPFRFGQNDRNFSCRCAIQNGTTTIPPQVKFRPVSGCVGRSNQFRPISGGMGISAGIGFALKK